MHASPIPGSDSGGSPLRVAFEADGPDGQTPPTWSVHVNGVARHDLDDPRADGWAWPGLPVAATLDSHHLVSISIDRISGRRVVASR